MPPPQATEALYSTLQRYQLLLVLGGRRLWSQMGPDFDQSWPGIAPSLEALTSGAQLAAATAAVAYVPEVLAETGQPDRPEARIRPQAFAGVASDGRSLAGLLEGAVVNAKRAAKTRTVIETVGNLRTRTTVPGLDGGDALAVGQRWLDQALRSAVNDAARDATAASIVARPGLGWVRIANPPCCSRCAVLASTFYHWNKPNPRHPGCDCLTQPVTEADSGAYLTKPDDLVKRGLITDLTGPQKARIDDGHNLVKVLNESRDRWRERMVADRRDARYANYTPTERRAADRRAAARVASGQDIQTVNDFMAHLTSRVDALAAMKAAGIAA